MAKLVGHGSQAGRIGTSVANRRQSADPKQGDLIGRENRPMGKKIKLFLWPMHFFFSFKHSNSES
jgi:hypothetical protein